MPALVCRGGGAGSQQEGGGELRQSPGGGAGRGALNLFGQCPYGNNTFKKSRNGDTLGPVELIL